MPPDVAGLIKNKYRPGNIRGIKGRDILWKSLLQIFPYMSITAPIINADIKPLMIIISIQFNGTKNAVIVTKIPSPIPNAPWESKLNSKRESPGKNLRDRLTTVSIVIQVPFKMSN